MDLLAGSTPLDPTAGPRIGSVTRVEGGMTIVRVEDLDVVKRITVNDLVAVDGPTPSEFLVALVESTTPGLVRVGTLGTLTTADLAPARFLRGAHTFPYIGARCYLIDGELLVRFMSLLGENVPREERLVLGRFVGGGGAAVADGNKLFQRHLSVLGSTGAGKSWTVALMLERMARLEHPNVIVLDMHGEYTPLTCERPGAPPIARRLRIAGPGDQPDDDVVFLPYWLLDRDEMLSLVLDESDADAASQAMRFTDHLYKLKRGTLFEIGREGIADTFTVDSPIPFRLSTLVSWLRSDDTEKIVKQPSGHVEPGPYYDRLTRFIGRLEARISDGRYAFMFQPPEECLEYGWLERFVGSLLETGGGRPGIKIIDFSEVPAEALPVVAGVIARLLYDVQFWMDPAERTPIAFVCDEAHLYLPASEAREPVHRVALRAFEQIAKEGRKYGVGLVMVTQRPADVSRTIVAQCNNFVVMRLTNDRDQHVVRQLVQESLAPLTGVLPTLEPGEAVVLGDALLVPTPIRFDPPTVKPASATRAFWNDWATTPANADAVVAGVESLRRQLRPADRAVAVSP